MTTLYLYNLQPGDLYYDPVLNWTLERNRLLDLLRTKPPTGYSGLSLVGGDGSNTYVISQNEIGKVQINDKGTTGTDRLVFRADVSGYSRANLSVANFFFTWTPDFVGIEEIVLDNNKARAMTFDGSLSPRGLRVFGSSGYDNITGTIYNDYLDGGGLVDTLTGGKGDDTYVVTKGDRVVEWRGEGTDTVKAYCSWTLAENFENLELIGPDKIWGRGNYGRNIIKGNDNDNTLDGYGGIDTLIGGKGDDTYWVRSALDSVIESSGEGVDTIFAVVDCSMSDNIEKAVLMGRCSNLKGNALDNYIQDDTYFESIIDGGAGNDRIVGGKASDILTGGSGADVFEYGLGDAVIGPCYNNFERITDFQAGVDIIDVPGNTLKPVSLAWNQAKSTPSDFCSESFVNKFYRSGGLPANGACAITFGYNSIVRTFIVVNSDSRGFDTEDYVIEITGYTGSLSNITVI